MLPDDTRSKIKDITAGNVIEGGKDHCTAIRNLLCGSFATSTTVKKDFESQSIVKKEQQEFVENYCQSQALWVHHLPGKHRYLTRGGEARVYLEVGNKNVIKINEAVYYATWLEFFNSVLLHNYIFSNTSYNLLGFTKSENSFSAVLAQPFIVTDDQVELSDIKAFLSFNGFENYKRNDYIHRELGLILEDMHDENVLVNSDILFFIDTVFYTVSPDWLATM